MFLRGKPQVNIKEFAEKLQELRLVADLDNAVIQECLKVEN
jgi:hypothetical protein